MSERPDQGEAIRRQLRAELQELVARRAACMTEAELRAALAAARKVLK